MSQPTSSDPTPGGRRVRRTRGRRVLQVLVCGVVVLAMVAGLGSLFLFRHLNGNLTVLDPGAMLTGRPAKEATPDEPTEPLNILVMGSDTREGSGNNIDGLTDGGARSDTTILFHLSADRTRAYGISIPRDSVVDRPDCTLRGGDVVEGASDVMWNDAFAEGGPLCTVQQFEQTTGVFVDHFVVVDFGGFRDMVDAIDGVEVCIPEDIDDPAHGIDLAAGTRELSGFQALNYVRARYTLGDGSDIGRIKRQQAFVAAMANKVVSGGVLARLDRLVPFLDAATKSLVVDPGLSNVLDIGRIGLGFRDIGLSDIRFSTIPFEYDTRPGFEGRVVWAPEAERVWARVAADRPLTRRLEQTAITAGDVPGEQGSGQQRPGSGSGSSGPSTQDPQRAADLEAAGLCS